MFPTTKPQGRLERIESHAYSDQEGNAHFSARYLRNMPAYLPLPFGFRVLGRREPTILTINADSMFYERTQQGGLYPAKHFGVLTSIKPFMDRVNILRTSKEGMAFVSLSMVETSDERREPITDANESAWGETAREFAPIFEREKGAEKFIRTTFPYLERFLNTTPQIREPEFVA